MCYEIYCRSFKARDEKFSNGGQPKKPTTPKEKLIADVEVKLEKINKKLDDVKSTENRTILNAKRHFFEAIKNELSGQGHLNADYQQQAQYFNDGGELDEASNAAKPAAAPKPKEKPLDRPVKDVKVKRAKRVEVEEEEVEEEEEIEETEETEEEVA